MSHYISKVRAIRDEQLRQRREAAACSVERERAHWERGREEWIGENRREEEEGEGRRKVGQIMGNEWSQDEQIKRAWALGVSQQFVLPRWLSLEAQKRSQ